MRIIEISLPGFTSLTSLLRHFRRRPIRVLGSLVIGASLMNSGRGPPVKKKSTRSGDGMRRACESRQVSGHTDADHACQVEPERHHNGKRRTAPRPLPDPGHHTIADRPPTVFPTARDSKYVYRRMLIGTAVSCSKAAAEQKELGASRHGKTRGRCPRHSLTAGRWRAKTVGIKTVSCLSLCSLLARPQAVIDHAYGFH